MFIVASAEKEVRAEILINGQKIESEISGKDVTGGIVTFSEDRLYRLVEDEMHAEKTLEVVIESTGVEFFTFTFG